MQSRSQADPFLIPNPDSTRHYRWISDNPQRMAMWLRSVGDQPGYQLVQGATVPDTMKLAEKLGLSGMLVDKGRNFIRVGFNVLASIPVEEYVLRQQYLLQQGKEQLDDAKDNFLGTADAIPGVKGIIKDPEEMLDEKKVKTRTDRPFAGQVGGSASKKGAPAN